MDKIVEKKFTFVTGDIVSRVDKIRKNIKRTEIDGRDDIIKGIDFFEILLREINPPCINDEVIQKIEIVLEHKMSMIEDDLQKEYMQQGIDKSLLVLHNYNHNLSNQHDAVRKRILS